MLSALSRALLGIRIKEKSLRESESMLCLHSLPKGSIVASLSFVSLVAGGSCVSGRATRVRGSGRRGEQETER